VDEKRWDKITEFSKPPKNFSENLMEIFFQSFLSLTATTPVTPAVAATPASSDTTTTTTPTTPPPTEKSLLEILIDHIHERNVNKIRKEMRRNFSGMKSPGRPIPLSQRRKSKSLSQEKIEKPTQMLDISWKDPTFDGHVEAGGKIHVKISGFKHTENAPPVFLQLAWNFHDQEKVIRCKKLEGAFF
jgi:hypothetical protein